MAAMRSDPHRPATADEKPKPSRLKKVGSWLLVGIPGAIAFCATVKVEDAKSNLAGWLHLLGVERVPALLSSATADLVALAGGIVGAVIGGFFVAWYWLAVSREPERLQSESYTLIKGVTMTPPKDLPGHGRKGRRE